MKYPKPVQEKLKILDAYTEVENLKECNILHLYDDGLAYPNGYHDARFFILWAFNTHTMEKCNLGQHDACDFDYENVIISKAQVFADGAFLIKFVHTIKIPPMPTQCIHFVGI